MRVSVSICFILGLFSCAAAIFGRSLRGSGRSRFAALLQSRRSRLFGNRVRGRDSIFSAISSQVKSPVCHFARDGVPQFSWPTKDKLCFDESYPYPTERVFSALEGDADAMEFMLLVQEAYVNNPVNVTGTYGPGGVRYRDLCSEEGRLLERIWWTNTQSGQREVCYVIMPEYQGVHVPLGGGNCHMDQVEVQNHYCVPDGYVDRDIYVFCPGELKACRRTQVTVPTGCSCKKYDCQKFEMVDRTPLFKRPNRL